MKQWYQLYVSLYSYGDYITNDNDWKYIFTPSIKLKHVEQHDNFRHLFNDFGFEQYFVVDISYHVIF